MRKLNCKAGISAACNLDQQHDHPTAIGIKTALAWLADKEVVTLSELFTLFLELEVGVST